MGDQFRKCKQPKSLPLHMIRTNLNSKVWQSSLISRAQRTTSTNTKYPMSSNPYHIQVHASKPQGQIHPRHKTHFLHQIKCKCNTDCIGETDKQFKERPPPEHCRLSCAPTSPMAHYIKVWWQPLPFPIRLQNTRFLYCLASKRGPWSYQYMPLETNSQQWRSLTPYLPCLGQALPLNGPATLPPPPPQ